MARPAAALRRDVLVPAAPEHRGLFGERDDRAKLHKSARLHSSPWSPLEDVEDALTNVIDPELGLDFVELGLIYGVEVEGGHVHVTFTLTSPGCPIGPQVTEQIEEFVGELDDVRRGHVVHDLHPAVDAGQDERRREVRARLLS